MTPSRRAVRLACCLALVGLPAGCSQGGGGSPPSASSSDGSVSTSASVPIPSESVGASPTPPAGAALTLTEGVEHDVCGIGLTVRFIPPSATTGKDDEAFLVGGPASQVGPSPDQPAPANVAPARTGAIATVLGKRFKVDAVDAINRRVSVEALC
jgi:hypothetical protein